MDVKSLVYLLIGVLIIVSEWKLLVKAGKPGWACLIPIYSTIVLLQIIKKPWQWIFWFLVPVANIVYAFIIVAELAKCFGKGGAWGVFLLGIFSFIGYPIIAFGDSTYTEPTTSQA
jgi:hypothetical protein